MTDRESAEGNFAYIERMLVELRVIAERERADMLAYLLEMALAECNDIITGVRPRANLGHRPKH